MQRRELWMFLGLTILAAASAWAAGDCDNRPSRASDAFWDYIKRCGCNDVEAVSPASSDYAKWTAACEEWRLSHPAPYAAPTPSPSPSASPSPAAPRRRSADCVSAPSRGSDAYWSYIDRCGCEDLDSVSRASKDYDRWASACDAWKRKNAFTQKP